MLTLEQITNAARIAAKEFPIKSVELFGSYAEGRADERSDVDLLVEFDTPAVSLIVLSRLRLVLEDILNTEVDIIHAPIAPGALISPERTVPIYAA